MIKFILDLVLPYDEIHHLKVSFSSSAHLAALPSSEWRSHRRGSLTLTSAVAMVRLPGRVHLCGQESGIMGRDCSRSCDSHSGIAGRERCKIIQLQARSSQEL